jgi:AcrR family transcriptional regulator
MSASERREIVIREAAVEFARRGYDATSTEAIAKRVGVSQPYLFRLFGSKRELFYEVARRCFDDVLAEMRAATGGLTGHDAIIAMRLRYRDLLASSPLLPLQLQIYAAAIDDPKLRELGRAKWAEMWRAVASLSGGPPEEVLQFLSVGMVVNVLTAFDVPYQPGDKLAESLDEWAAGP